MHAQPAAQRRKGYDACACGVRGAHLTASVARPEARKMSCDSSGTFHTRHVRSQPAVTQRSCRPTSMAVTCGHAEYCFDWKL